MLVQLTARYLAALHCNMFATGFVLCIGDLSTGERLKAIAFDSKIRRSASCDTLAGTCTRSAHATEHNLFVGSVAVPDGNYEIAPVKKLRKLLGFKRSA